MPPFPIAVLLLAGFTLAHAAWSVSDTPASDLLIPLAIRQVGGQRELLRFEAETQAAAIQSGKAQGAAWTRDSTPWAFAREGLVGENGTEVDVLSVDFCAPSMERPATIIQRFRRYTVDGRVHLLGRMQISVAGKILADSAADVIVEAIERGVAQHSRVAPLWATWK
jgi:hypothetical protein